MGFGLRMILWGRKPKEESFYMNHPKIKSTLLKALERAGSVIKAAINSKKKIEK